MGGGAERGARLHALGKSLPHAAQAVGAGETGAGAGPGRRRGAWANAQNSSRARSPQHMSTPPLALCSPAWRASRSRSRARAGPLPPPRPVQGDPHRCPNRRDGGPYGRHRAVPHHGARVPGGDLQAAGVPRSARGCEPLLLRATPRTRANAHVHACRPLSYRPLPPPPPPLSSLSGSMNHVPFGAICLVRCMRRRHHPVPGGRQGGLLLRHPQGGGPLQQVGDPHGSAGACVACA